MKLMPILALAALVPRHLVASDYHHYRDVRIVVSTTPETDDVDQTFDRDDLSGKVQYTPPDSALQQNYRYGLNFIESIGDVGPYGGCIVGLGIMHSEQKSDDDATNYVADGVLFLGSIRQTVNVLDLSIAYALPISSRLHLELGAFGGYGTATSSQNAVSVDDTIEKYTSATAHYYEYGPKAGLFYTWPDGLQLGIEGGNLTSHAKTTIREHIGPSSGPVLRVINDIDQSGPFAALDIGFRF